MSEETTTATTDAPQITTQDIVFAAKLIQVIAGRGAFKAEELTVVGEYYDKLVAYLTSVGAITQIPPDAAPVSADTTTTA